MIYQVLYSVNTKAIRWDEARFNNWMYILIPAQDETLLNNSVYIHFNPYSGNLLCIIKSFRHAYKESSDYTLLALRLLNKNKLSKLLHLKALE